MQLMTSYSMECLHLVNYSRFSSDGNNLCRQELSGGNIASIDLMSLDDMSPGMGLCCAPISQIIKLKL